jgi:hypothetical protein
MRRVLSLVVLLALCGGLVVPARAADTETAIRVAAMLPAQHIDRVLPSHTDVYTVHLRAGQYAVFVVIGDGSTDLDLQIRDPLGASVARDFGPTDDCICAFTVELSGDYTVEVINRGGVTNRYLIASN